MKRTFLLAAILALTLIPLVAQAHNFAGTGDCDSWNLVLDGDWGAHTIYVDGVDVAMDLTPEIADTSTAASRSFTVLWDKTSNDVTVTHTLNRVLENCVPVPTSTTTTTTLPEETTTTTTLPEVTTTTGTPPITTTTGTPPITTTLPAEPTTTLAPETTTTQVLASSITVVAAPEELPLTGVDSTFLIGAAALLVVLGAGALRLSRKVES